MAIPTAVLEWNFDEPSGATIDDVSGSGNTGILTSSGSRVTGHTNTGLKGTAVGSSASMAGVNSSSSITIRPVDGTMMAWVFIPSTITAVNQLIFGASSIAFKLYYNGSTQTIHTNFAGYNSADVAVPTDTWFHVAVVWESITTSTIVIYVNGSLGTSYEYHIPNTFGTIYAASAGITVDDLRVFQDSIIQADIVTLMNTPIGLPSLSVAVGSLTLNSSASGIAHTTASGTAIVVGTADPNINAEGFETLTLIGTATSKAVITAADALTLAGIAKGSSIVRASRAFTLDGFALNDGLGKVNGILVLSGIARAIPDSRADGTIFLSSTVDSIGKAIIISELILNGVARGTTPQRDITVKGSLDPQRWTSKLESRKWKGDL